MKATVQDLKKSIIKYVGYMVKDNTTKNHAYEEIANDIYRKEIAPFVVNENITTWESDIKKKFFDNPYVRFDISEKQAWCLANAFSKINPETIINA